MSKLIMLVCTIYSVKKLCNTIPKALFTYEACASTVHGLSVTGSSVFISVLDIKILKLRFGVVHIGKISCYFKSSIKGEY